jgi:hypothetical protein
VASGGGVDSMLRFWLKRLGDKTKRCRKMKWRQQAHLGSMGMKCDTARCYNIGRRRGDIREGKGKRQHQLD